MAYLRRMPLVEGEIYHLFNRSINLEPIFSNVKNCRRALTCLDFYRFLKPPARLSHFLLWSKERKQEFLTELTWKNKRLVDILSFCLMPNHFHLLLKQLAPGGIRIFLSVFQNSYTRYFNTKNKRVGPIFQGRFKAVRVETDQQLTHLSRYIHLNPYSSYVVKSLEDLEQYPWSSLPEYIGDKKGFCQKKLIFSLFDSTLERYKKFVFDQADYQRRLDEIKHLIWD